MEVLLIVVVLTLAGGSVLLAVEGTTRLRTLYDQGGEVHWNRLAATVQLMHGHSERGQHLLEGRRDGVWMHVEANGSWMIVRGRLDVQMPSGFLVRRWKTLSPRASLRTGSPLLDSTLHISGEPASAQLLRSPALVAPMMSVVHAWPGSFVDERHVVLRYPDALGRHLDERCQEVVELVLALRGAQQHARLPEHDR